MLLFAAKTLDKMQLSEGHLSQIIICIRQRKQLFSGDGGRGGPISKLYAWQKMVKSLCLIKHYTMNEYEGVEVQLQHSWPRN
jgi:hypothetical protein